MASSEHTIKVKVEVDTAKGVGKALLTMLEAIVLLLDDGGTQYDGIKLALYNAANEAGLIEN